MKRQFPSAPVLFAVLITLLFSQCTNDNLISLTPKKASDSTSTSSQSSNAASSSGISSGTTTPTPVTTPSTTPAPTPATTVTFSTDIKSILTKYQCASCHGSYYATYSGASSLANSGILYGAMAGSPGYRRMPPGQSATSTELAMIKAWIAEGTPNN